MTSYQKKKFDRIHGRNYYAKELHENHGKYRQRIVEQRSTEEPFSKAKVLKGEYDEED